MGLYAHHFIVFEKQLFPQRPIVEGGPFFYRLLGVPGIKFLAVDGPQVIMGRLIILFTFKIQGQGRVGRQAGVASFTDKPFQGSLLFQVGDKVFDNG